MRTLLSLLLLGLMFLNGCVSVSAYRRLEAQVATLQNATQPRPVGSTMAQPDTGQSQQAASPAAPAYGDGPFNQVWIGWHPSHPFPDDLPGLTWRECAQSSGHQCRTILNETACPKVFRLDGGARVIWRDGVPMPGPEFILEVGESASFIIEDTSQDPYITFAAVASYRPLQKGNVYGNRFQANPWGEVKFANFCSN